jgi:hypothetical protein
MARPERTRLGPGRVGWRCTVAILLFSGWPAPARAQSSAAAGASALEPATEVDDELDAARTAFREGVRLAKERRWQDALVELRRSLALHAHAATHYNVGLCELELGHRARARHHLSTALGSPDKLDPERAALAREKLERIDRSLATLELELPGQRARLSVDGRPLTPAPGTAHVLVAGLLHESGSTLAPAERFSVLFEPGRYELTLHIAGEERVTVLDLASGERRRLLVEAPAPNTIGDAKTPAPRPRRVRPPPPAPALAKQREPAPSFAPWAFGVAAVAVASAGVFGYLALDTRRELDELCPEPSRCPAGSSAKIDALERFALLTDVSLAAAVAGAGTGLWLTLAAPSPAEPATGAHVRVRGTF